MSASPARPGTVRAESARRAGPRRRRARRANRTEVAYAVARIHAMLAGRETPVLVPVPEGARVCVGCGQRRVPEAGRCPACGTALPPPAEGGIHGSR